MCSAAISCDFLATARATGTVTEPSPPMVTGTAPASTMRLDGLLGALEGVDDLPGRQLDVAAIDQAQRRDRIEVGMGGIEAAHQRPTAGAPSRGRRARRYACWCRSRRGCPGWPPCCPDPAGRRARP